MKVLLRQPLANHGRSGDLIEVSDAYARNFLLPQKLAVVATPAMIAQAQRAAAQHQAAEIKQQQHLTEAQTKMQGLTVTIAAKANEQGKLFAAVKADQVYRALIEQLHLDFPQPHFSPDQWKIIGAHPVMLAWPNHATVSLTLQITHGR